MTTSYEHHSPQEIQKILEEYQPGVRGKGLKALAKRYNIKSGHSPNGTAHLNHSKL